MLHITSSLFSAVPQIYRIGSIVSFFIILLLCNQSVVAESVVHTNALDDRQFDYFELDNKLKVLLVSDDSQQKAAAALDVHVGAGEDPENIPGLAHFLEHMLFLGTKKYPEAGSFQAFISDHGGSNNAYTSVTNTNYYFDVDVAALDEALDRFAEFFVTPQFNRSLVERERKAVHSEYTSKYILDSRRTRDVFRELVHPAHPIANFTTGNEETLGQMSGEKLREALIAFYKKHYSANIMTLVVAAPLPLEVLKKHVISKFKVIPNRNLEPVKTEVPLFKENTLPMSVRIKPNKQNYKLSMIFPVGNAKPDRPYKPLDFIGNFIGHEGKGSLLALLKENKWATSLNAGGYFAWRDGETFAVNIRLTPEGLDHVDTIQSLVFDYIALLKQRGVTAWRYEELAQVSLMSFEYAERGNTIREVSHLASKLQRLAAKDLYFSTFQWKSFDKGRIHHYLDKLTPENLFTVVIDPETVGEHQAYYYQTPYRLESSKPPSSKSLGKNPEREKNRKELTSRLALPKANPYIPSDFAIVGLASEAGKKHLPNKILNTPKTVAWYLNDNQSDLPKAAVLVRFKMPVVMESVENYVALRLLLRMIKESLNEESYSASLAGLSYSLSTNSRGFDLEFFGYNDTLDVLAKRVVKKIKKSLYSKKTLGDLIDTHFEVVKQEMLRAEKNKSFDKLYSKVLRDVPPLLYDPLWSVNDIAEALATINEESLLKGASSLFDHGRATIFVYGNVKEREARAFVKPVKNLIRTFDSDVALPPGRVVKLIDEPTLIHRTPSDTDESAIAVYYQGLSDSVNDRAAMLVLEQYLSAPFYHALRTEQQLGYVVSTMNYAMRKVPGIVLLVQSPTASALQLNTAIQTFLSDAAKMDEDNFQLSKKAVLLKLSEPPQSQWQWANRYWSSIVDLDDAFKNREKLIQAVEVLSFSDVATLNLRLAKKGRPSAIFYGSKASLDHTQFGDNSEPVHDYLQRKKSLPKYTFH